VAVYDRALSPDEVLQNFDAGPLGEPPVNQPPVANAGLDATVVLPNTLTLSGSVVDDGLPDPPGAVSVSWSQVSGTGTASFGDGTSLTSTVSFDVADSYTLRLTVNDGESSGSDDVVITVQEPAPVPVPDVTGLAQAEAETAIVSAGLVVGTVTTANSDTVPAGNVISQDPVGGTLLPTGSAVDITVSLGPVPVPVPDVTGFLQATAESNLVSAGFAVGSVTNVDSDLVPAGNVVSQVPPGGSLAEPGSAVDLAVSSGPAAIAFTEITASAGVAGPGTFGGHGGKWADVDGNGLPDLYVTMNFLPTDMPDLFYRNQGGNVFEEQGVSSGIDNFDTGSHGGVWADLDNDGDYDLFNGSYDQNRIYRNDGTGIFTDVTVSSGLPARSLPTRGVVAFDMEGDGDLDLFAVSNSQGTADPADEPNELYRNDGGLIFTEISVGALVNAPAGQGTTAVDYDNDGDLDIFAGNRTGPVNILQNDGNGVFTQITPTTIGIDQESRDGVSFADLNNDGWLDLMLNKHLFIATGNGQFTYSRTFESATNHYMGGFADLDNDGDWDLAFPGNNYVYLNDGNANFSTSNTFSLGTINDPRCVSFADVDKDGDVDFFYAQKREFNRLVRNDLSSSNRWVKILLQRASGQLGAPGARVTIFEAGGLGENSRRIVWAEANAQQGYLAQDDPELHLGVGASFVVDVLVEFHGGTTVTVTDVVTNASYLVQESPPP
jgi:hypothetical protein